MLPLIMGAVLIASGALKIGRPVDLDEAVALGLPAVLRRRALLMLHPWGELALGVALVCLGGVLGTLAAAVTVVLMGAYLVLVARARRADADASCSCFGIRQRITRLTVVRNAWLTAVALGATAVAWTNPVFGGPLAAIPGDALPWIATAVIVAVTVALIAASDAASEPAPRATQPEADYLRVTTPAVAVTRADGTTTNLRRLASKGPVLLLAVSETCGSCASIIDAAPAWRERLPELRIHLLVTRRAAHSALADENEPQTLHDEEGLVAQSLGPWSTPAAVLLGADGMLAGGPVSGSRNVSDFVDEIEATLREGQGGFS